MAKRRRSRAGRPRANTPRAASGRKSRAYQGAARDSGTEEARLKRLFLVNGCANETLASIPADIAFARAWIDGEQHKAALKFRAARVACFGSPLSNSASGIEPTEDRIATNENRYSRMLKLLTEDEALACIDFALDIWPRWMRKQLHGMPLNDADRAEHARLISGLNALT